MSDGTVVSSVIATVGAVIVAALTGLQLTRNARESSGVSALAKENDSLRDRLGVTEGRLDEAEKTITQAVTDIQSLREQSWQIRRVLDVALDTLRRMTDWDRAGRRGLIPQIPHELTEYLWPREREPPSPRAPPD